MARFFLFQNLMLPSPVPRSPPSMAVARDIPPPVALPASRGDRVTLRGVRGELEADVGAGCGSILARDVLRLSMCGVRWPARGEGPGECRASPLLPLLLLVVVEEPPADDRIGRRGTAGCFRGEVSPRRKVVAEADAERNDDAEVVDEEADSADEEEPDVDEADDCSTGTSRSLDEKRSGAVEPVGRVTFLRRFWCGLMVLFWVQFVCPETPDAAESECDLPDRRQGEHMVRQGTTRKRRVVNANLLRVFSALASFSSYFC